MEHQWNDIQEVRIPDEPVIVKQCNNVTNFGCRRASSYASGIIKLKFDGKESFAWDGQTYLIKVTHWRDIMPDDLTAARIALKEEEV